MCFYSINLYIGSINKMLHMDKQAELKKEFELERLILLSDAVFAIAITLLIIEIKFTEIEKGASTDEILHAFKPVIIRFPGFMLSFFFIGLKNCNSYGTTFGDEIKSLYSIKERQKIFLKGFFPQFYISAKRRRKISVLCKTHKN